MKQREVTDKNNTRWTCIQTYAGLKEEASEKAEDLTEKQKGKVDVVCTPSGGAKTVRIELAKGWEETATDDDLVASIESGT